MAQVDDSTVSWEGGRDPQEEEQVFLGAKRDRVLIKRKESITT